MAADVTNVGSRPTCRAARRQARCLGHRRANCPAIGLTSPWPPAARTGRSGLPVLTAGATSYASDSRLIPWLSMAPPRRAPRMRLVGGNTLCPSIHLASAVRYGNTDNKWLRGHLACLEMELRTNAEREYYSLSSASSSRFYALLKI